MHNPVYDVARGACACGAAFSFSTLHVSGGRIRRVADPDYEGGACALPPPPSCEPDSLEPNETLHFVFYPDNQQPTTTTISI